MADEQNLTIKIPERIYVGFQKSTGAMPMGLITPDGTDSAAKKRRERIDSWTRNSGLTQLSLENKPMVGFRISRACRASGWYGKSTVVHIEDPRGFEVQINAVNMMMLTDENTIQNGEILAECVWGRDAGEMLLLPVNSEPYKMAAENTRRENTKTNLRTVKIGDKVLTAKGLEAVYMGPMQAVLFRQSYREHDSRNFSNDGKKRYVLKETSDDGKVTYNAYASVKVSEVLEAAPKTMTPMDAVREISEAVLNGTAKTKDQTPRNWYHRARGFSVGDFNFKRIELVPITEDEVKERIRVLGETDGFTVIGKSTAGEYWNFYHENFNGDGRFAANRYIPATGYFRGGSDFTGYPISKSRLDVGVIESANPNVNLSYSRGYSNPGPVAMPEQSLEQIYLVKAYFLDIKTNEEFSVLM